jgi:hypothetical protein
MRSPAPRYPTLRNVQDGRSPGFSDRELREIEEGERLVAHRSRWACLPGRRGGRTDRCAGRSSRYRPRSAMASATSNRMVKGLPKTGFGLKLPATFGLRLSRFRGFPLSGDRPTRGMACRGRAPADPNVHGRRPLRRDVQALQPPVL